MKILVTRFSALGDVAIAVKVIAAVVRQNPNIEIILLTKKQFTPLFKNIERVTCLPADFKKDYKGIFGLFRLYKQIKKNYKIKTFIDIHNVLRTKILRLFFFFTKKSVINKGRKEKKQLTKRKNKKILQLKNTALRYAETFQKVGINVNLDKFIYSANFTPSAELENFIKKFDNKIAIAPFAAHKTKQYPIDKMEVIISHLQKNFNIFILGGGNYEKMIAKNWQNKYQNVHSVIGKFSLTDEIALIDKCFATITMDSGNMHLASLTNTYIISIWGATHRFLGFAPYNFKRIDFIEKKLDCRPCSVFGSKDCFKNSLECLDLPPEKITEKILNISNL